MEPFYPVSLQENQSADLKEIEKLVFLIDHTYQIYKLKGCRAGPLAQKVQKALYPRGLSPEDLEMDQSLDSILDLIWVFLPKT